MPGAMQVFPVCQSEPFLEVVQRRISDHAKRLSRHVVMRVNRINWADVSNRGAALVVLSTLVVGLGAFLYHFASGSSWGDSVFNVYSILFNVPGASVTEEERGVSTLVLNLIFLAGLLVFAVLIGMVSEEIGGRLLSIRNGEGPLTLKGHILLLNWNSQIDSIIKQLNIAQKFKTSGMHDQAIVVLANMDRDEMLMSMNELLKKKKMKAGSDIYCRKGRPYRLQDLSLVSVSEASIIILLCPENTVGEASAETLKAATIATLSTMTDFSTQSLIVQVPNEVSDNVNHVNLVQDLFASNGLSGGGSGGMRIVRLSEQSVIDRLVAQSSLQPGLCTIYENILRHGKEAEFVWVEANDDLRGKFSCARKRFPDAVTLGYISSYDGELHLNPGDSDIVTPGDKFILLCRGGHNVGADPVSLEAGTAVFEAAEAQAEDRVSSLCASVTSSRKVLVLGWAPEDVGELVAGFAEFSPPGTEVTFIVSKLHPDLNKYIQRTLGRQNNHNRALLSQRTIAPSRPLQASLSRTRGSNSSLGYSLPSLSRGPTMTRRSEMSNYDFQTQNPFDDEDRDSGAVSPRLKMKLSAGSGSTAHSVAPGGLSTDSSVDNIDRTIGRYPDRGRVSISGADKGLVYDMGRYPDRGRVSLSGADKGLLSDKESQWDRSVDCSARNSMNNPSSTLRLSPRSSVVNGGIVGQLPPQHSNMLASENLGGSLKEINSGGSNNPMAVNFSVGNVSFKFKVHKDPMGEEAMRIGKVDRADSVIIGLPTTIPYPYSDSQVLATLLQIQNIAAETSHQVHVVAKVNNSNTKKVAKKFFENMMRRCVTFELLISSQITSAILTQVAWQPSYIMIMEELLVSSEGMEMYLVEPSRLGFNKGETITFAEVTESARALSYTAMGYCKKSRTAYAQVLAPPASKLIRIEAGDKFILLAEEWD